jgi:hypothetical protein
MAATAFDPTLAGVLAQASELTYEQYQKGIADPNYNGDITPPAGYQQTASLKAPEIDLSRDSKVLNTVHGAGMDLSEIEKLRSLCVGVREVFFGFTLQPKPGPGAATGNVLAFRGTQSIEEFLADAAVVQVPVPLIYFNHGSFELAKVHLGFLVVYLLLHEQVKKAVKALDTSLPLFVTGHSLGAALAILAAVNLDLSVYRGGGPTGQLQMVNFASPRVGDPAFVGAYNGRVPASYRVVNLADVVPLYPPTSIFGHTYAHVGLPGAEWSYLDQTGDVATNHALAINYIPAVTPPAGPVETNAPRTYPTSGL